MSTITLMRLGKTPLAKLLELLTQAKISFRAPLLHSRPTNNPSPRRPTASASSSAVTKLPADTTEPVDIVAVAPNHTAANQNAVTTLESSPPDVVPRIAFRLADQRSRVNAAGDEWMYELKDTEDQISYAAVAAVFNRIVAGEAEEANRLWKRLRVQSSLAVGVPKDRKPSTAVLDSESETITAFTDVTLTVALTVTPPRTPTLPVSASRKWRRYQSSGCWPEGTCGPSRKGKCFYKTTI